MRGGEDGIVEDLVLAPGHVTDTVFHLVKEVFQNRVKLLSIGVDKIKGNLSEGRCLDGR